MFRYVHAYALLPANEFWLCVFAIAFRLVLVLGADESRMDIFDDATQSLLEGKSLIMFIFYVTKLVILQFII